MPKQQQLVYLSYEQFQTLVAQGSITVDGQIVEYSEDDIYVTPQEDAYIKPATGIPASDLADDAVPVRDVQVNGSSVLQNGIANINVANLDAVADDVNDLKSAINDKADESAVWDITGNEPIVLDHKKSYIITSGATADISGFVTSNDYACAVVACSEGESFLVATRGQNGPRAWAFVSSDGTVLQREDANKNLRQYKRIVAPANSAYLIINNYRLNSVGKAYKGQRFLADAIASSFIAKNIVIDTAKTLHDEEFLSPSLYFVRSVSGGTLSNYVSDLPQVYADTAHNVFVLTAPFVVANGQVGNYWEQFVFSNDINTAYFRAFSVISGVYELLRDWQLLFEDMISTVIYPYLHHKKGIILGDSISYGLYSFWDGTKRKNSDRLSPDYAPKRISDYFADLAGMNIDNIAARGTGYAADTRNLGNALVKARATDFSQYDFVGLCFGINDYIQNKAIGTLQADEEGTVVGNLSRVLKKIYGDNPLAKVVIFSPYNVWGQVAVNQNVNILYGDESTNYALGYANNAGYTLQQLVDAIDAVANHYGVTHERLNKSNVVNRINIKDIMIDGLHPSLEALPMLAAEMFAQKDFG